MPKLQNFDRMIPEEGIIVYPDVLYIDANDVTEVDRQYVSNFIYTDPVYSSLFEKGFEIYKGQTNNRCFCVYVKRKEEWVGVITLREKIDNPHGFGEGDFLFTKYIFPTYQKTKYSRYASGDLIHMVFYSGLANRLYSYMPANSASETKYYWDKIDPTLPCLGKRFPTDGPDVQKYIQVVQEFETKFGPYVLVEFNGETYRDMDLVRYFMTSPGRSESMVEKWMKQMNLAAEKVKAMIES